MCNVMSKILFFICSGYVIEAHLVHSQDLCNLSAFGHRLFSSPIHVLLCLFLSIASPSKIAGGNGIWQLLMQVAGFWLDLQFAECNFLAEHGITKRIQIVSQFSFVHRPTYQGFFASRHYRFESELRRIII